MAIEKAGIVRFAMPPFLQNRKPLLEPGRDHRVFPFVFFVSFVVNSELLQVDPETVAVFLETQRFVKGMRPGTAQVR